jgi:hypothetical protein
MLLDANSITICLRINPLSLSVHQCYGVQLVDLNIVKLEVLKAQPSTMLAKFAPQATSLHRSSSGSSSEAVSKPRASELTRVFNIVNDAKESGITLEAAGGAAVLPILDALVREGRVRRVFDMMQVRFLYYISYPCSIHEHTDWFSASAVQ